MSKNDKIHKTPVRFTNYSNQTIPEEIKSKGLKFSSLNIFDELQGYIDIDTNVNNQVKDLLKELKTDLQNNKSHNEYPVCVLSHMFDPRRSKFLVNLKAEANLHSLNRKYFVFVYEDQKDLYTQFENIENVKVHYIPMDKEEYLSLGGKRQYILEFLQKNEFKQGFFIEDDCIDFCLPVGAFGETGSFRNKRYTMSFNMTFTFWEFISNKFNLHYSGPVNNMEFAFKDLSMEKNKIIKPYGQVVQCTLMDASLSKELNLNFDHNSGWDDYDMNIQQCVYGKGTCNIHFSYFTPALKSGVSAMSNSASKLAERCEKNSKALINKWGYALVREDKKKDLFNAKVNWLTLKKLVRNGFDLKDFIGKTNDEAKIALCSIGDEDSCDFEDSPQVEEQRITEVLDEW